MTLSFRRNISQTREQRLILLRVAYYQHLQTNNLRFVGELNDLVGLNGERGSPAREAELRAFILRWNLPQAHAVADIEAALRTRWDVPSEPQLGRVDLARPFSMSRPLSGAEHSPTVHISRTHDFVYNPLLKRQWEALRALDAELRDFLRVARKAAGEAYREASQHDVIAMPPGWSEKHLALQASRVYSHTFLGRYWKEIAEQEEPTRAPSRGPINPEHVRKGAAGFARQIGVSTRRAFRPT